MRKLILFAVTCLFCADVLAQANTDSAAYQAERKKINNMLAVRSDKFGRYDQSLKMHTGIFGLQTKKDIRRSNDILMDIVKTDNDIYKELKILLEYRMFQQKQVQSHSQEAEASTLGYMNTINKLRNQVDQLKAETDKQQAQQEKQQRLHVGIFIAMLGLIIFLIIRKSKRAA